MKGLSSWVVILAILSLTLIPVLVACAPPAPAPQAPAPAAPAKKITKLTVIFPQQESLSTGGLFALANHKGFFMEEGLEIEPVWTAGGGEQVQAVVSGSADMAIHTGFAAVAGAFKKEAPITIISAADTGYFITYWYVKSDSPIKDFTQFSGKKVGYSNPGSGTHMALLALEKYYKSKGWQPFTLQSAGSQPSNLAAVLTGQLDVGWAGYPVNFDLLEEGKIRAVFNAARDMPGYDEIIVRVNFARNDLVQKNPGAIRAFLRAWKKSIDSSFANPQEAFLIYSGFTKTPMASPYVIGEMPKYLTDKSRRFAPLGNIEQATEKAIAGKFLSAPLTQEELKRLINLDFVPK